MIRYDYFLKSWTMQCNWCQTKFTLIRPPAYITEIEVCRQCRTLHAFGVSLCYAGWHSFVYQDS